MIYLLHTHLCFPGWDLYDLRDLDNVSWVGSVPSSSYTHVFLGGISHDLDLSHMYAWVGSA